MKMKKTISMLAVFASVFSLGASPVQAEEPDISQMSIEQRFNYEFNADYSQIYSDITCYDSDYVRSTLTDAHWQAYFACKVSSEDITDEQKLEALDTLHEVRENTPQIENPELSKNHKRNL